MDVALACTVPGVSPTSRSPAAAGQGEDVEGPGARQGLGTPGLRGAHRGAHSPLFLVTGTPPLSVCPPSIPLTSVTNPRLPTRSGARGRAYAVHRPRLRGRQRGRHGQIHGHVQEEGSQVNGDGGNVCVFAVAAVASCGKRVCRRFVGVCVCSICVMFCIFYRE